MKLLSHSTPEKKTVKVKIHDADSNQKEPKKIRETKEQKEKKGRYWGIVFLLLTVIAAVVLHFLKV